MRRVRCYVCGATIFAIPTAPFCDPSDAILRCDGSCALLRTRCYGLRGTTVCAGLARCRSVYRSTAVFCEPCGAALFLTFPVCFYRYSVSLHVSSYLERRPYSRATSLPSAAVLDLSHASQTPRAAQQADTSSDHLRHTFLEEHRSCSLRCNRSRMVKQLLVPYRIVTHG